MHILVNRTKKYFYSLRFLLLLKYIFHEMHVNAIFKILSVIWVLRISRIR